MLRTCLPPSLVKSSLPHRTDLDSNFPPNSALSLGPKVKAEPLLKPYVCSSGSATTYCSTS
jgi:hypothetical protein